MAMKRPIIAHAILTTVLLLVGSIHGRAESEKAAAVPAWTSDKTLSDRLAAEVVVEGFRIRPPRGYNLIQQTGPQGEKAYGWRGEARSDGVSPSLTATVMTAPPEATEMPPLKAMLDSFLRGIKSRRTDWKQSDAEAGGVN